MEAGAEELSRLLEVAQVLLERGHFLSTQYPAAFPACKKFSTTHHEVHAKIVRAFPKHPGSVNLRKVDVLGAEAFQRDAGVLIQELRPLYQMLQDMIHLQQRTLQLLKGLDIFAAATAAELHPVQLISDAAALFCDTVRTHFLARQWPASTIFQLYTLACCVHTGIDPPQQAEVLRFVESFGSPCPYLQKEFSPVARLVGQILDQQVVPHQLDMLHREDVVQCALPDISSLSRSAASKAESSAGYSNSSRLYALREWQQCCSLGLIGFLICPDEALQPRRLQAMQALLQQHFLIPIYRQYSEWAHELYAKHVRPAIMLHQRRAPHLASMPRAAWPAAPKALIAEAYREACRNCMEHHRHMRCRVQQALHRALQACAFVPPLVIEHAEGLLACLGLARAEILWYFLHVDEAPSASSLLKGLLMTKRPLADDTLQFDPSLPELFTIMQQCVSLLQSYRTAIQQQWKFNVAELQAFVPEAVQNIQEFHPVTSEDHKSLSGFVVHLTASAEKLLSMVKESLTKEGPGVKALLGEARHAWNLACAQILFCPGNAGMATVQAASKCTDLLPRVSALLDGAPLAGSLLEVIDMMASLSKLAWRGDKLQTIMNIAMSGQPGMLKHAPAWLWPVCQLHPTLQEQAWIDTLWQQHMHHVMQELQHLLEAQLEATPLQSEDQAKKRTAASAAVTPLLTSTAVASRKAVQSAVRMVSPRQGSARTTSSGSVTPRAVTPRCLVPAADKENEQPEQSYACAKMELAEPVMDHASETRLQALMQLVTACMTTPPQHMSDGRVILWKHHLLLYVQSMTKYLLSQLVFVGKGIQRPEQIRQDTSRLFALLASLGPFGPELVTAAKHALLEATFTPLDTSSPPGRDDRAIVFVAEWYVKYLLWDDVSADVCYNIDRGEFYSLKLQSSKSPDPASYANVSELQALLAVFGACGAKELGSRSERPLEVAVAGVIEALNAHQPVLQYLDQKFQDGQPTLAAIQAAASQITNAASILHQLRIIARCLAFRQLLARALVGEALQVVPEVAIGLASAAVAAERMSSSHMCELVGLPWPSSGADEHVCEARFDPGLQRALLSASPSNFPLWPLLLGLLVHSNVVANATYSPIHDCSSMDCLGVCATAFHAMAPELVGRVSDSAVGQASTEDLQKMILCAGASLTESKSFGAAGGRVLVLERLTETSTQILQARSNMLGPYISAFHFSSSRSQATTI